MKTKAVSGHLLATLLLTCATPSFAIYKCESGGKVIYSDAACINGKALQIDAAPPADADAALRRAAQEKRQAEQLERSRQKRAASEDKEHKRAARAEAAQQKKCDTLARRQKWADEDAASASGRKLEAARRKARRAAEEYLAECRIQDRLSLSR